ncbi:hypothetical protein QYM36_011925 [Artemia franciscana]|uniref:C2 domain-containing protein n=1 Tax=Artemia franciscana TaxID=6661 RepID=A0AA88HFT4_ARTSF|nr:hypothetical protein QYM36_011925 [Artemia franciscana]
MFIRLTVEYSVLEHSVFERNPNPQLYIKMSCNGKNYSTDKVENGHKPIWNYAVDFEVNENELLDMKFRMKEQRKMLGLINRGKRVGNGGITIKEGELKAGTFIVDIRKNRSQKPVAKLHIKVEELDSNTEETPENDNFSLSSVGSSTTMEEEEQKQEENSELLLKDINQVAQVKKPIFALHKDEEGNLGHIKCDKNEGSKDDRSETGGQGEENAEPVKHETEEEQSKDKIKQENKVETEEKQAKDNTDITLSEAKKKENIKLIKTEEGNLNSSDNIKNKSELLNPPNLSNEKNETEEMSGTEEQGKENPEPVKNETEEEKSIEKIKQEIKVETEEELAKDDSEITLSESKKKENAKLIKTEEANNQPINSANEKNETEEKSESSFLVAALIGGISAAAFFYWLSH